MTVDLSDLEKADHYKDLTVESLESADHQAVASLRREDLFRATVFSNLAVYHAVRAGL
jgi:hypothetical protein